MNNAKLYIKKGKHGKQYLKIAFTTKDGKVFDFETAPKFLNKKQYRYLMVNVSKYENE